MSSGDRRKSHSVALRESGDNAMKKGQELKRKRNNPQALKEFREACRCFRDSVDEAETKAESSSAYKNLGLALIELYSIEKKESYREEARNNFFKGIGEAIGHQSESWLVDICDKLRLLAETCYPIEEEMTLFYHQAFNRRHEWGCHRVLMEFVLRQLILKYKTKAIARRQEITTLESNVSSVLNPVPKMAKLLIDFESSVRFAKSFLIEIESYVSLEADESLVEHKSTIVYEEKSVGFLKAFYNSRISFEKRAFWDALDKITVFLQNNEITLYEGWGKVIIAKCLIEIDQEIYLDEIRELLNEAITIFVSNGVKHENYYYAAARELSVKFQVSVQASEDEKIKKEREELLKDTSIKEKLEEINQLAFDDTGDMFIKKLFELFPNTNEKGEIQKCPEDEELKDEKLRETLTKKVIPIYSLHSNMNGKYPHALYREVNQLLIKYSVSCLS